MKNIALREIIGEERDLRDFELSVLRESSAIEGPLRPAVIKAGEIATYMSYGLNIVVRSTRSLVRSVRGPDDRNDSPRTPRNAYLD